LPPKIFVRFLLCCLLPVTGAIAAGSRPGDPFDVKRPDIRRFASDAAPRVGMTRKQILALLGKARSQNSIVDAMDRPAERAIPWYDYRARFLGEQRIASGVAFWREHRAELDRIAAERGVPQEYVVAILGVETLYGRQTGRYRVIDALATLSFDYPPRATYFRSELEQFLMMAHAGEINPLTATGSYAGAMGAPQFMPSSFRRYAVDGTGDGHRDLWQMWPDVFASVANYFVANGWQAGEPVMADAAGYSTSDDPLASRVELKDTVASLKQRGYRFDTRLPEDAPAMLVPAEQPDSMSWRVGFRNFYVITRYNRSPLYAMAVHDLATALRARMAEVPDAAAGASP
jgi:peptidoglycan lytic transglycosylase B